MPNLHFSYFKVIKQIFHFFGPILLFFKVFKYFDLAEIFLSSASQKFSSRSIILYWLFVVDYFVVPDYLAPTPS